MKCQPCILRGPDTGKQCKTPALTQKDLCRALASPSKCWQGQKGLINLNLGSHWIFLWFALILLMLLFPWGQTMPDCTILSLAKFAGAASGLQCHGEVTLAGPVHGAGMMCVVILLPPPGSKILLSLGKMLFSGLAEILCFSKAGLS